MQYSFSYVDDLYKFYDEHGIAYTVFSGTRFHIRLSDFDYLFDEDEQFAPESISLPLFGVENVNEIEFILPLFIKEKLSESEIRELKSGGLLKALTFKYIKETTLLNLNTKDFKLSDASIFINVTTLYGMPICGNTKIEELWGSNFRGI